MDTLHSKRDSVRLKSDSVSLPVSPAQPEEEEDCTTSRISTTPYSRHAEPQYASHSFEKLLPFEHRIGTFGIRCSEALIMEAFGGHVPAAADLPTTDRLTEYHRPPSLAPPSPLPLPLPHKKSNTAFHFLLLTTMYLTNASSDRWLTKRRSCLNSA